MLSAWAVRQETLRCPLPVPLLDRENCSYLAWATEALQKTELSIAARPTVLYRHLTTGVHLPWMPPYKSGSLCKCRGSSTNLQSTQSPVTDRGCMSSEPNSKGKIKGISNLLSRFREKKEKKSPIAVKAK